MATSEEILDVLEVLAQVHNAEPGDTRGYQWALSDYAVDILQEAAKESVRLLKWYPKPSELREIAERLQLAKERGDEPRRVYWRMCSLFGDLLSGRVPETDMRIVNAVDAYFGFEELIFAPDAPLDTRTDAEIEREWQEWKHVNAISVYA